MSSDRGMPTTTSTPSALVQWSSRDAYRLDETQLRRIVQLMEDQGEDWVSSGGGNFVRRQFEIETQDGTYMELQDLDPVLELENGGRYLITSLFITFDLLGRAKSDLPQSPMTDERGDPLGSRAKQTLIDSTPPSTRRIRVGFTEERGSALSITYVKGDSRDWALRIADELKDRVRRTRAYGRFMQTLGSEKFNNYVGAVSMMIFFFQ